MILNAENFKKMFGDAIEPVFSDDEIFKLLKQTEQKFYADDFFADDEIFELFYGKETEHLNDAPG